MRVREFLEDAFFEDLSMHTLSFKFNPSSSTRMPAAIQQQDAAVAEALPVKSIVFLSKNLLLQARKSDRSQFHVWLTTLFLFHPSTWPNFSQFKGFNFHWSFFRNYTKLGYRGYIKVGNRLVGYFSSFLAWLRVIHFFFSLPKVLYRLLFGGKNGNVSVSSPKCLKTSSTTSYLLQHVLPSLTVYFYSTKTF